MHDRISAARRWMGLGAIGGLLTVTLGAFGAHGLNGQVPERLLATWDTATSYLGIHAIALLICGLLLLHRPGARMIDWAAWGFFLGSLVFSGSLYMLVIANVSAWGAITPIGGVTLIVAWGLLALGTWRHPD